MTLQRRQSGILMPISCLPSRHGIGDLGEVCLNFIDNIVEAGFSIWQILPLNPVGFGNSPYQAYSSFAGEELYVNLDKLYDYGLLDEKVDSFYEDAEAVHYEEVRAYKNKYFLKAYENFKLKDEFKEEFEKFKEDAYWLDNFALFRVYKKKNYLVEWQKWPYQDKKKQNKVSEDNIEYEKFIQFMFFKQWNEIKDYAHSKNIKMMGDIPIYVGSDSADVWQYQKSFLLDDIGYPTSVAGCPPDCFSDTGQLWGNPIYDWDYLKEQKYDFWIKRMKWNMNLFDIIRLDHFRAFDTYWKIPAGEKTAVNGKWVLGPAYDFFDTVFKELPDIQLIAEDLGDLRDEVTILKDHYHMLGMKIIQHSLGDREAKVNYQVQENCVAYTGTHDNETIVGWYHAKNKKDRDNIDKIMKTLKYNEDSILDNILLYTLECNARIAIIPMQDILGLDNHAQLNFAGTVGSPNWEWKLKSLKDFELRISSIHKLLEKSCRL